MSYGLYCPKCHRPLEREQRFDEGLQDFVVGVSCCGLSCFEQQIYSEGLSDDWWETWDEIHRMYSVIQDLLRNEPIGSTRTRSFAFRECMKALDLALVPRKLMNELYPPMEELVDDKYWTPPEFLYDGPSEPKVLGCADGEEPPF